MGSENQRESSQFERKVDVSNFSGYRKSTKDWEEVDERRPDFRRKSGLPVLRQYS